MKKRFNATQSINQLFTYNLVAISALEMLTNTCVFFIRERTVITEGMIFVSGGNWFQT